MSLDNWRKGSIPLWAEISLREGGGSPPIIYDLGEDDVTQDVADIFTPSWSRLAIFFHGR